MRYCLYALVRFNSNFMVVANFYDERSVKLKIYDLKDIKNPKSEANEVSVHTCDTNYGFKSLTMDETEIFFGDIRREKCIMQRLNFGSFELFHNETKSVTLSLPWRGVWRSKGVDEEPLEPVRHMEAYKEVLKYFHRLSTDSRAAIKTYPIFDANLENFTLGDDIIGFRRHRPEIIIYDENMEHRPQEMEFKTVQINKNTYVSVTGKTVNLINSTTGNVIKEIRLSMGAINLHFNCNLLVFVCKIGEHEHLLSVWRVGNSLNLTHLLDVAIGDYDGSLQVDDQFIAVKNEIVEWKKKRFFYFISMKTFQVERSLSSRAKYLQYDNGYLFVLKKEDLVGILDVASGTFLRDIRIKPFRKYQMIFRVNSNYVVMAKIKDASKTARRNAQYAPSVA
jgi:hypothetical protein